jgi:hypothetical protein
MNAPSKPKMYTSEDIHKTRIKKRAAWKRLLLEVTIYYSALQLAGVYLGSKEPGSQSQVPAFVS